MDRHSAPMPNMSTTVFAPIKWSSHPANYRSIWGALTANGQQRDEVRHHQLPLSDPFVHQPLTFLTSSPPTRCRVSSRCSLSGYSTSSREPSNSITTCPRGGKHCRQQLVHPQGEGEGAPRCRQRATKLYSTSTEKRSTALALERPGRGRDSGPHVHSQHRPLMPSQPRVIAILHCLAPTASTPSTGRRDSTRIGSCHFDTHHPLAQKRRAQRGLHDVPERDRDRAQSLLGVGDTAIP